jgi:hypothetical protein
MMIIGFKCTTMHIIGSRPEITQKDVVEKHMKVLGLPKTEIQDEDMEMLINEGNVNSKCKRWWVT